MKDKLLAMSDDKVAVEIVRTGLRTDVTVTSRQTGKKVVIPFIGIMMVMDDLGATVEEFESFIFKSVADAKGQLENGGVSQREPLVSV